MNRTSVCKHCGVEIPHANRSFCSRKCNAQVLKRSLSKKIGAPAGKKWCSSHQEYLPIEAFSERRTATVCKSCTIAQNSDRYKKTKLRGVSYLGGSCSRCGYSKCIAALGYHHKDPTTKAINWSSIRRATWEKLKAELDKCELLCANCHAEVHWLKEIDESEHPRKECG